MEQNNFCINGCSFGACPHGLGKGQVAAVTAAAARAPGATPRAASVRRQVRGQYSTRIVEALGSELKNGGAQVPVIGPNRDTDTGAGAPGGGAVVCASNGDGTTEASDIGGMSRGRLARALVEERRRIEARGGEDAGASNWAAQRLKEVALTGRAPLPAGVAPSARGVGASEGVGGGSYQGGTAAARGAEGVGAREAQPVAVEALKTARFERSTLWSQLPHQGGLGKKVKAPVARAGPLDRYIRHVESGPTVKSPPSAPGLVVQPKVEAPAEQSGLVHWERHGPVRPDRPIVDGFWLTRERSESLLAEIRRSNQLWHIARYRNSFAEKVVDQPSVASEVEEAGPSVGGDRQVGVREDAPVIAGVVAVGAANVREDLASGVQCRLPTVVDIRSMSRMVGDEYNTNCGELNWLASVRLVPNEFRCGCARRCVLVERKELKVLPYKWRCRVCRREYSANCGKLTRYWNDPISELNLMRFLAGNVSFTDAEKQLGSNERTCQKALRLNYLLALMYRHEVGRPKLGGSGHQVSMDEWVAGRDLVTHEQILVFGMIDAVTGKRNFWLIERADRATIYPLIRDHVLEGSVVVTDSSKIYYTLCQELGHEHYSLVHYRGEYMRMTGRSLIVTTDPIEGQWSALKRVNRHFNSRRDAGYAIAFFEQRKNLGLDAPQAVDYWVDRYFKSPVVMDQAQYLAEIDLIKELLSKYLLP